jgi:hypothetical protein
MQFGGNDMTSTDLQIMQEIIARDAELFKALAHPTIVHCTVCDHEWCLGLGFVCDWCGEKGEEIKA